MTTMGDAASGAGRWIESHRYLAVTLVLTMFILSSSVMATRKLMWDDEFFTLYLSGTSSFEDTWAALMTGADQHPPSFYFLTRLFFMVFGVSHLSLRLPAIAGFALMMLCLYVFVARRTSPVYGIAAMLFPLITGAGYYATEARGYALVLGFSSLALVSWQAAAEGMKRYLTIPSLAFALAAAVGSHYYAVLLLGPLGFAEIVRAWRSRHLDWPLWIALSVAALPVLLFSQVMAQAGTYAARFWAKPRWYHILDYYEVLLQPLLPSMFAVAVVGFLYLHFSASRPDPAGRRSPLLGCPHETAILLALTVLPVLAVLAAKLITNAFHRRYVMAPLLAIAIIVVYLCHHVFRGRLSGGVLLIAAFTGGYAIQLARAEADFQSSVEHFGTAARFLDRKAPASLPLITGEYTAFHQMSFYGPSHLSSRVVYLADPDASYLHIGHDTVDRGLLALRKWFPVDVRPYRAFIQSHNRFAVWGYIGNWSWTTFELKKDNFSLALIGRERSRLLFHATGKNSMKGTPEAYAGRARMLKGPSLCHEWTNDSLCELLVAVSKRTAADEGVQQKFVGTRTEISDAK